MMSRCLRISLGKAVNHTEINILNKKKELSGEIRSKLWVLA